MKRALIAVLLAAAAGQLAAAAYIPAKAWLAQQLLRAAWERSADGEIAKPWPWADTHPVARLTVPRLGIEQIVLSGLSGRTLAFGPGWAEASAVPGSGGRVILGGHRDTSFAFLRELAVGDELLLETPAGARARYRVSATEIVDARDTGLDPGAGAGLTLVTCYPFDAVDPGGPLRYVVVAEPR